MQANDEAGGESAFADMFMLNYLKQPQIGSSKQDLLPGSRVGGIVPPPADAKEAHPSVAANEWRPTGGRR